MILCKQRVILNLEVFLNIINIDYNVQLYNPWSLIFITNNNN